MFACVFGIVSSMYRVAGGVGNVSAKMSIVVLLLVYVGEQISLQEMALLFSFCRLYISAVEA
jgi:hypothetical protein